MLTFLILAIGAILVIVLCFVVLKSGNRGGRHNQAGDAAVTKQVQNNNPRGDVRSGNGLN